MTLKNRNFINVAGVLALVIICLFAFSSCFHEHTFGEWSYAVLPMCTEAGVQSRMCTKCEVTEERPAEPLGHAPKNYKAKAPTCTETGNEAYVACSRCDYTTFKEIEALGHKEVQCDGKPATCTEKGYEPYVFCERCDYRTYKEIPALGHDEVQHERKQSTCLETGWTAYVTCSRCDYTTFKELPLAGHQQAVLAAKQPTCTETGLTVGSYCKLCNTTIRAQEIVAAKGHSCKQGICTVCGVEDYTEPDQYASKVCYDSLLQYQNGEKMQKLYDLVYEAARTFHLDYSLNAVPFSNDPKSNGFAPGTIDISQLKLVQSELDMVRNAFKNDNPIFYWFVNTTASGYVSNTNYIAKIRLVAEFDYLKGSARKQYNLQIANKIKYYASFPEDGMSRYEIALCYYDAIIEKISYAYEAIDKNTEHLLPNFEWTQNIIGAFCKDRTVCAGYGRAFGMLLSFSGIEARTVVGYTSPEITHLWTLAKMDDGNWYWFDPTWDDDDKTGVYGFYTKYNYFCVNDTQKVNWSDAHAMNVGMSLGTENFLDQHDIDDGRLSVKKKNYYLPERSAVKFSSDEVLELRESFTVNDMTFALSGSREVRLVGAVRSSKPLIIPSTVSYNGVEYKVTSIGYMASSGLFDCTRPIFNGYFTSVVIPNTVEYISARAISSENVAVSIFYEGTKAEWNKVQPGAKYTAKSKIYFFSEKRPTASGNYWHYVNGVATPW